MADDIASDAFERAFAALSRFDERRPFAPWLHRIVVNRALDLLRAERRLVGSEPPSSRRTPALFDDDGDRALLEAVAGVAVAAAGRGRAPLRGRDGPGRDREGARPAVGDGALAPGAGARAASRPVRGERCPASLSGGSSGCSAAAGERGRRGARARAGARRAAGAGARAPPAADARRRRGRDARAARGCRRRARDGRRAPRQPRDALDCERARSLRPSAPQLRVPAGADGGRRGRRRPAVADDAQPVCGSRACRSSRRRCRRTRCTSPPGSATRSSRWPRTGPAPGRIRPAVGSSRSRGRPTRSASPTSSRRGDRSSCERSRATAPTTASSTAASAPSLRRGAPTRSRSPTSAPAVGPSSTTSHTTPTTSAARHLRGARQVAFAPQRRRRSPSPPRTSSARRPGDGPTRVAGIGAAPRAGGIGWVRRPVGGRAQPARPGSGAVLQLFRVGIGGTGGLDRHLCRPGADRGARRERERLVVAVAWPRTATRLLASAAVDTAAASRFAAECCWSCRPGTRIDALAIR